MPTTLVLGAGGLGLSIARAFQLDGHAVLLVGRSGTDGAALGVPELGADLAEPSEMDRVCLWAAENSEGGVEVLVLAMGDMVGGAVSTTTPAVMDRLFRNNVAAVHLGLSRTVPLLASGAHRFVLGAYVERLALPKLGAYAAAKAAVDSLVRTAMKEDRAVKTTLLRLPAVDTGLWKKAPYPLPKEALSPDAVGASVVRAWKDGKTGVLDL